MRTGAIYVLQPDDDRRRYKRREHRQDLSCQCPDAAFDDHGGHADGRRSLIFCLNGPGLYERFDCFFRRHRQKIIISCPNVTSIVVAAQLSGTDCLFAPSRFRHQSRNESSYTSQPRRKGRPPIVSNVPSSHMLLSVRRESGGVIILCFLISLSISESLRAGLPLIFNACFIV